MSYKKASVSIDSPSIILEEINYFFRLDEINVDCLSGTLGADYIGTLNVTKSGKSCKSWSLVKNVTARDFSDGSVEDAATYCRNPFLHRDGPWCYISEDGSDWERCDIKMCPHLVNGKAIELYDT
jgi:CUB/sushi domain-containing protein